jgi:hypothetical protein
MLTYVKGPTPWAVVLCRFKDVPAPSRHISFYTDFFLGSDPPPIGGLRVSAGLFDYWRDVSYGAISLTGSVVRGWYTMQYSFRNDWRGGRGQWIDEAIRLSQADIDLSQYQGVVAVVNAPVDDSALPVAARTINGFTKLFGVLALASSEAMGQSEWRWCHKCQGLFYANGLTNAGACPADGQPHENLNSGNYAPSQAPIGLPDPNQDDWRWCHKCQGMFFASGRARAGVCPFDRQAHENSGSADYVLMHDLNDFVATNRGQDQWRWCHKCQGLFYSNAQPLAGVCPADNRQHDASQSANYILIPPYNLGQTFSAHEMGHGYGLDHSFDTSAAKNGNRPGEYGDPLDIMSAMSVQSFSSVGPYGTSGPGVNTPTLLKLGWMPPDRVRTKNVATGAVTVDLAAVNHPADSGFLMARVVTPDRVYTAELRRPDGWDRGIGAGGVFIHQLVTPYTTGQNLWRWCKKCQGLYYAGRSACPAGGAHAQNNSANYRLTRDTSPGGGQHNWRWCSKCQGLGYGGGTTPGNCAAGGLHDHSVSSDYVLMLNRLDAGGQGNWRWCRKCQGLAFGGRLSPGACPAQGVHDFSQSGDYHLPHNIPPTPPVPSQDEWRWCHKCEGLAFAGFGSCPVGGFHDGTESGDYSLAFSSPGVPGQAGWRWCRKCFGMGFGGNPTPGACPSTGQHDYSQSGDYTLFRDAPAALGQQGWRWCHKCQGLFYGDNAASSRCPFDKGLHEGSPSSNYVLANFMDDHTILIRGPSGLGWQAGETFQDVARGVSVRIDSIAGDASSAHIVV